MAKEYRELILPPLSSGEWTFAMERLAAGPDRYFHVRLRPRHAVGKPLLALGGSADT